MPTADEILEKYKVSFKKPLKMDADSILSKYGITLKKELPTKKPTEIPSPMEAEFEPFKAPGFTEEQPSTTLTREKPFGDYEQPIGPLSQEQIKAETREIAERERAKTPGFTLYGPPTAEQLKIEEGIFAGKPVTEREYRNLEKTFLSRTGKAQGDLLLKAYKEFLEDNPEEIAGGKPEAFLDNFIKHSPMGLFPRLLGIEPRFARVEAEALKKKHRAASQIGKAGGDLMTLIATSQIGGALTSRIAYAGKPFEMAFRNGKLMFRLLSQAAGKGTTWGLKGLLSEASRQRDREEYSVKNLIKETAYEGTYGLMWGTSLAIPKAYLRITSAGASRMLYDSARTLIEKHKISKEDLLSISLNGAVSAALASIGAVSAERDWRATTDWTYGAEKVQDPLMQRYMMLIKQGAVPKQSFFKAIKNSIRDVKNIRALQKLYPGGRHLFNWFDLEGNNYILTGGSHLEHFPTIGKTMLVPNVVRIPAPSELRAFLKVSNPIAVVEIAKNLPPNLATVTPEMQSAWVRAFAKGFSNTGDATTALQFANKVFQGLLPLLRPEIALPGVVEKKAITAEPIKELEVKPTKEVTPTEKEITIGERTYKAKLNKNALEGEEYNTKQAMVDAWFKDEKGEWKEVKNWETLSKLYDELKKIKPTEVTPTEKVIPEVKYTPEEQQVKEMFKDVPKENREGFKYLGKMDDLGDADHLDMVIKKAREISKNPNGVRVVAFDVDGLKILNTEKYGGDYEKASKAMKQVVDILKEEGIQVNKIGGDEFGTVLLDSDRLEVELPKIVKALKRIKNEVKIWSDELKKALKEKTGSDKLSVSVGFTDNEMKKAEGLVDRAKHTEGLYGYISFAKDFQEKFGLPLDKLEKIDYNIIQEVSDERKGFETLYREVQEGLPKGERPRTEKVLPGAKGEVTEIPAKKVSRGKPTEEVKPTEVKEVKPPKEEIPKELVKNISTTKTFGYPPEEYKFTGEFSRQEQGYYRATKNKKIVFAPIYKNKEGKIVVDISQAIDKKKIDKEIPKELQRLSTIAKSSKDYDAFLESVWKETIKPDTAKWLTKTLEENKYRSLLDFWESATGKTVPLPKKLDTDQTEQFKSGAIGGGITISEAMRSGKKWYQMPGVEGFFRDATKAEKVQLLKRIPQSQLNRINVLSKDIGVKPQQMYRIIKAFFGDELAEDFAHANIKGVSMFKSDFLTPKQGGQLINLLNQYRQYTPGAFKLPSAGKLTEEGWFTAGEGIDASIINYIIPMWETAQRFEIPFRTFSKVWHPIDRGWKTARAIFKPLIKKLHIIAKGISPEGLIKVGLALDGKLSTGELNIQEKRLYMFERVYYRRMGKHWVAKGLVPESWVVEDYLPHLFEREEYGKVFPRIAIPRSNIFNPHLLRRLGKKGYTFDPIKTFEIATWRGIKKQILEPTFKQVKPHIDRLPRTLHKLFSELEGDLLGSLNDLDYAVERFITNIGKTLHIKWLEKPYILKQVSSLLTNAGYLGGLGLRTASAFKNLMQGLSHDIPLIGLKYAVYGWNKILTDPETREMMFKKDVWGEHYLPFSAHSIPDKLKWMNKYFELADRFNRGIFVGARKKMVDYLNMGREGELLKRMPHGSRAVVKDLLEKGEIEEALDEFAFWATHQTQWYYSKLAGPPVYRGAVGRIIGQYGTWWSWQFGSHIPYLIKFNLPALMKYVLMSFSLYYGIRKMLKVDMARAFWFGALPSSVGGVIPQLLWKDYKVMESLLKGKPDLSKKYFKEAVNSHIVMIPGGIFAKEMYRQFKIMHDDFQITDKNGKPIREITPFEWFTSFLGPRVSDQAYYKMLRYRREGKKEKARELEERAGIIKKKPFSQMSAEERKDYFTEKLEEKKRKREEKLEEARKRIREVKEKYKERVAIR